MAKKILVADDDLDIVETVKMRLEASGYEVSTTKGAETIGDARQVRPDLILLDVVMPDMDGFAVIREIKRDPDLATTPVIVFSGKSKEAMMELFGPEGIAGYISKPYDPKVLASEIQRVIG
jgi:two-component system, OmpR family, response regulator MtrA